MAKPKRESAVPGKVVEYREYTIDIDAIKRSVVARANAEAAKYCAEHGLDTVEKMREFVKTGLQGMRATKANMRWAARIIREPGEEG